MQISQLPFLPPLSSKIKQNAPEILKVCRWDAMEVARPWKDWGGRLILETLRKNISKILKVGVRNLFVT
jgi:hypothetical protein